MGPPSVPCKGARGVAFAPRSAGRLFSAVMTSLAIYLVFVHVAANLVWIGSILAVARVLSGGSADRAARATIALDLYRRLATPAFGISFLAGAARLALSPAFYFSETKFMHAKLFFAVVVIAVHHVIGGRAKKGAAGTSDGRLSTGPAVVLLLSAVLATYFVVTKPF